MVFGKLLGALKKTREVLTAGLSRLFSIGRKLDEDFLDELEHVLYQADIGAVGSPGDEGERFAAKILGVEIEPEVLARIEREDDRKSIRLDGREIAIEEAAITFTAAFLATKPNSINTGSAV